jgi:hypothetical protein
MNISLNYGLFVSEKINDRYTLAALSEPDHSLVYGTVAAVDLADAGVRNGILPNCHEVGSKLKVRYVAMSSGATDFKSAIERKACASREALTPLPDFVEHAVFVVNSQQAVAAAFYRQKRIGDFRGTKPWALCDNVEAGIYRGCRETRCPRAEWNTYPCDRCIARRHLASKPNLIFSVAFISPHPGFFEPRCFATLGDQYLVND